MPIFNLDSDNPQPAEENIQSVLEKAGLKLSESHASEYNTLLSFLKTTVDALPDDRPIQPRPDLEKYPRTDIHIPEDTDHGGWATKVTAKCTAPKSNLLEGRTVALKDNVALAGVRCTNGTTMVDWVPEIDATVATRVMDAGAIIIGKAACENSCMETTSCSSSTGPVHNPFAEGYSTGGSSSGCGRLVATGSVDLAIGSDQGGSIRVPAASCGIVGLKPTWGLVPYTGILSLDTTVDHTGPMARTVRDCALLLDVIAGPDGWDDRQAPKELGGVKWDFVRDVDAITRLPENIMLQGMKVGILAEGFEFPGQDQKYAEIVRSAAMKLADLGATVSTVSVPKHIEAGNAWMCAFPSPSSQKAFITEAHGRKQLYLPDRTEMIGPKLTQAHFDAMGPGAAFLYFASIWSHEKYGHQLYGRCMNLLKAASDAYDLALGNVDVLITPTLLRPPVQLPKAGLSEGPLKWVCRTNGLVRNTGPFNGTGHPALSLPVGFSPALEDANVKLPVGMQIIGRKYRDVDCLKVAAAWENAFDWQYEQ